ncbi:anthrone oxygenase family protein [Streptomyces sp. SID3343]|uniref:anthrone oxygenase family protein n=1 Tax=Streptomyces sp. SID3343 TaxID=2690260 RepID=UPI0013692CDB|nr:anthrone oxygenase family protein [Streptomyces sp. SID3343]
MNGPLYALTLTAAVGSAAMGGVFHGFSSFVMKGLGRLPAAQGAAAMNSINVTAVTAPFMAPLFGTALLCLGLGIFAIVSWSEAYAVYLLLGALLYLVGTIGTTAAYHVPRNDALAAADPDSPEGQRLWATYLTEWTRANHVRTVTGIAAAVPFALALTR